MVHHGIVCKRRTRSLKLAKLINPNALLSTFQIGLLPIAHDSVMNHKNLRIEQLYLSPGKRIWHHEMNIGNYTLMLNKCWSREAQKLNCFLRLKGPVKELNSNPASPPGPPP